MVYLFILNVKQNFKTGSAAESLGMSLLCALLYLSGHDFRRDKGHRNTYPGMCVMACIVEPLDLFTVVRRTEYCGLEKGMSHAKCGSLIGVIICLEVTVAENTLYILLYPKVFSGNSGNVVQNVLGILFTFFISVVQSGGYRYQHKYVFASLRGGLGIGF